MSAPQFTPGPWLYAHRKTARSGEMYNTEVFTYDGGSGRGVIATCSWCPKPSDERGAIGTYREANARLIAAAPRLHSDAEFLCARIRELESEMTDDGELSRQYFGHVLPAVARMESSIKEARGETL